MLAVTHSLMDYPKCDTPEANPKAEDALSYASVPTAYHLLPGNLQPVR